MLIMKVLIAELFWQHTEVLGTWIDYFCRRGDSVTVFYPELKKTPHNYIGIWSTIYGMNVNYDGLINVYDFDIIVVNTCEQSLVNRLRVFKKPIIAVNHYAASAASASAASASAASASAAAIYNITVNPFGRQACPKFVLPIAPALANILSANRRQIPGPAKKIAIVGNSFMSMPAPLFKQLAAILSTAGWTLTAYLYSYNNIDEYISEHVTVKSNCLAIDLFKEINESRYILFYPAPHHFFNQLSGSIILSLLFGRPLLTLPDVLARYNIECHYNLNDTSFLFKLLDEEYYRVAQQHLDVRINEFIAEGRGVLDSVVENITAERAVNTMTAAPTCD
jgi:hypothetical protein